MPIVELTKYAKTVNLTKSIKPNSGNRMSTAETNSNEVAGPPAMPGAAGAETSGEIPSAYDVPLENLLPINPRLFSENRWQECFERLRAEDPVHFNQTDMAGRFWSLTKYDDIKRVDSDWQKFSSANGITLGFPIDAELPEGMLSLSTFIAMDPPVHDVQRKTVTGVVAPANLVNLEPLIRERTCGVLDSLPEGETFDWVDTVSIELTTMMLATLFDFPFEDRRKLTRWSDVTFAVPQPGGIVESVEQRRDELLECLEYFSRLKAERLVNPGSDLVSMLAHGEDTKDMPPMEYLGNLLLLIVGGNDTTRNTMSGSIYALNKFPNQYEKLVANPKLLPQMVAEVIRWQTPLAYMRRTANNDCEVGGKPIKRGDQVLMWYVSGNRDSDVFDKADELDIERGNARQHLSFGFGIHRCMGNRLAELQLRILWEEILKRFDKIEVQDEPEFTFSSFVKGYTHLPVKVIRRKE
jgi:cytochrome P450